MTEGGIYVGPNPNEGIGFVDAVNHVRAGATIKMAPGEYTLEDETLIDNMSFEGLGDNADDVVLHANFALDNGFLGLKNLHLNGRLDNDVVHLENDSSLIATNVLITNDADTILVGAVRSRIRLTDCALIYTLDNTSSLVGNDQSQIEADGCDFYGFALSHSYANIGTSRINSHIGAMDQSTISAKALYVDGLSTRHEYFMMKSDSVIKMAQLHLPTNKSGQITVTGYIVDSDIQAEQNNISADRQLVFQDLTGTSHIDIQGARVLNGPWPDNQFY